MNKRIINLAVALATLIALFVGVAGVSAKPGDPPVSSGNSPVPTFAGGPDAFGYTFANSGEPGVSAYNWEDISGTGTAISLTDDAMSGAVPIGFTFNYYGANYTDIYVSSNGFITVLPGQYDGCCQGFALPNLNNPNGMIAGWWMDLDPGVGGTIHYQMLGSAPHRRFIVQYTNVPYFWEAGSATFEIKLFEGSNIIEVHQNTGTLVTIGDVSLGIEDPTGTIGLNYATCTNCSLGAQQAIRYAPPLPDLVVTTTNNVGGSVVYPNGWQWTMRVTNNGSATATLNGSLLVDNLPSSNVNYSFVGGTFGGGAGGGAGSPSAPDLNWSGSVTIPPSGYIEFVYDATPTAPGTYTNPRAGGVCVTDQNNVVDELDETNNDCVADTVTVTAPIISLSATNLNFGDQLVGLASAPQSVTVTNTGDADLHIGTLGITGDFGFTANTCDGATLAPAGTCSFDVAFQPLSLGPKAGTVSIPSDAYSGPNSVALSGNGVSVPAGANLLINPGYDDFITAPKAWLYSVVNVPLSSLKDCTYFISPGCSLKLQGSRTTRVVTQTVTYNGLGGQQFIYGLSSAAQNVPAGGSYRFEISLFNRFNRVMYTQTLWFTDGNHSWETLFDTFTAPAAFNKMRFRIYFQKGAGTAWFEDAFLMLWP